MNLKAATKKYLGIAMLTGILGATAFATTGCVERRDYYRYPARGYYDQYHHFHPYGEPYRR